MNKALLFIFLLCGAFAYAAEATESEESFQETTSGSSEELFQDWRPLSIAAIMTSILLIGIAYAVGQGIGMPEVKAWASNELVQAFANVVIIICLMAAIALLDVLAEEMVHGSGLAIPCTGGQSCLGAVGVQYLQSYIDAASDDAKSVAIKSIEAGGWAGRRFGIYCTTILCLQIGTTFSVTGSYILDQDRYSLIFEYYTNLLASLEAQKFFLTNIAFNIGPLMLAAGIVARSFFFTRKLGGLMIALAAGIMFFLPGMYVFNWITLDTALTGDKNNEDAGGDLCPPECETPHALAVVDDGTQEGVKLGSIKNVYDAFPDSEVLIAQGIIDGTIPFASPGEGDYEDKVITSCMVVSDEECPMACRELPYPSSLMQCMNMSADVPQNCAKLPDKCWVRRFATPVSEDSIEYEPSLSSCPTECKVVPPLKGDCDTGDCLTSRTECRLYKRVASTGDPDEDFEWSPNPPDAGDDSQARCEDAQDCEPDYDALQSCAYVIPDTGSCSEKCAGCPEFCRVITENEDKLSNQCFDGNGSGSLLYTCSQCPVGCKVNATHIEEVVAGMTAPEGETLPCDGCDAEKRIVTYGETMPVEYISGSCDISTCPVEDRVAIPRNSCEQCLFSEESEMYDPPIQAGCADLCKPSDEVPMKGADAYTGVGGEGLVGTPEIQNVSKLMLPAYVLPLFDIVATLIFIKGVSTMLGGDIDIPGISKVF